MNDNIGDNPDYCSVEKKNLLEKYDLTVEKLSFEYVQQCKNVKELEKICKVLRSNEEGHYPDLQRSAEEHLRKLSPESRILRVEEPVLRLEELAKEERDEVQNEMKEWEINISLKDEKLTNCCSSVLQENIPPIRRASSKEKKMVIENSMTKKHTVSDYASWDKYDADSELLKIDFEDDRKRLEAEANARKENERKEKEDSRLNDVISQSESLSETERCVLAKNEKDRGNEYYKVCDFEEAIKYYSASIAICPIAHAYSNRAACYLKLSKFEAALNDTNKCLELDPTNPKGLYRRALCLQHKLKFEEALRDIEIVLRKEPHNVIVRHVADKLRQQCLDLPRKVRMLIEEDNGDRRVVEMTEEEANRVKNGYEVNEFGLAKTMCKCYGQPPFLRNPNPTGIAEHLMCKPKPDDETVKKKEKSTMNDNCNNNNNNNIVPSTDATSPLVAQNKALFEINSNNLVSNINSNNNNFISKINCNRVSVKTTSSPPQVKITEIDDTTSATDLSGRTPETNNKILFTTGSGNSECDEIPKKIKIIEAVKGDSKTNTKKGGGSSYSVVKDMRGCAQGESELMEQMSNIKIDEAMAVAVAEDAEGGGEKRSSNKTTTERNKGTKLPKPAKSESSTTNNNRRRVFRTSSMGSSDDSNTVADFTADQHLDTPNKCPITIASKYKQKVASAMTPFEFTTLWSSVKENSNFRQYATILRDMDPIGLRHLLGNKLDEKMLTAMIKTLATEFEIKKDGADTVFVRQFLMSLTNVERFHIIIQFLQSSVKNIARELIDQVGEEKAGEMRELYSCSR